MKNFFLLFSAICIFTSAAWGGDETVYPNSGQIQVGDNYFGQSIGLSYSRNLTGPFWADFKLETASILFVSKAGQTFFLFNNNTNTDFNFGLDIHDMISAGLAFHREEKGTLRWLNSFSVGVTHFDLTVHVSYDTGGPSDPYQGQKDVSAFALYTELHLLDFYPPNDKLYFSLGIKGNTAFLSSPQRVDTVNGAGQTSFVSYANANGGDIMFPDLELFLGLGYGFE